VNGTRGEKEGRHCSNVRPLKGVNDTSPMNVDRAVSPPVPSGGFSSRGRGGQRTPQKKPQRDSTGILDAIKDHRPHMKGLDWRRRRILLGTCAEKVRSVPRSTGKLRKLGFSLHSIDRKPSREAGSRIDLLSDQDIAQERSSHWGARSEGRGPEVLELPLS